MSQTKKNKNNTDDNENYRDCPRGDTMFELFTPLSFEASRFSLGFFFLFVFCHNPKTYTLRSAGVGP